MFSAKLLKITFISVLTLAAIVFMDSAANAQISIQIGGSNGQTLGGVITNAYESLSGIPGLISVVAYIMGIYLAAKSMFEFKDHVDNPTQTPLSSPVKKFLAGGAFLTAPYMAKVLMISVRGENATKLEYGSIHGPLGGSGGLGMDKMIYNFIADIYGPMTTLLAVFCYIAGLILLIVGIKRMMNTAQDAHASPTGIGTIATFLVVGVLFSMGSMMGVVNESLFGDSAVSTYAVVSDSVITNQADKKRIETVIESLMAFVMLVGYIAFIRGWLVLRSFADGGQKGSIAEALTFIVGGALAINLGGLINVLQRSVGLDPGSGLTFQ